MMSKRTMYWRAVCRLLLLLLSVGGSASGFSSSVYFGPKNSSPPRWRFHESSIEKSSSPWNSPVVESKSRTPCIVRRSTELRLSSVSIPPRLGQWRPMETAKTAATSLVNSLRNNQVSRWRAAALAFFSSLFIFRKAIDVQLAQLWTHLMTSSSLAARIFRSDSYEWCLAVLCFVVYIHGFWFADRAVQKASEEGRVHPWRKYRLQDKFEADKHRRMVKKRAEEGLRSSSSSSSSTNSVEEQPPLTKQSEWNMQAWIFELWVYVLPLLTWDIVSPRRHRRLTPFGAPTTMQIVGGVTFGLLLYDFLFFCGHILMHKIPFLYRTIHSKHHKVQEVRAAEIVRLSLLEEVLEVGFSIVALGVLGVHPIARSIYNCIITFLLTELHCGFDFPWTPQNVIPYGLATGSRRHHYHHRNGKHYYQKFFFHVDRLFGFFQKDDGSLHGDSVKRDSYVPPSWK